MSNTISFLEVQIVDMRFMTRFTGLTDKWFYKLIQHDEFPRPIKFGRSSRWWKKRSGGRGAGPYSTIPESVSRQIEYSLGKSGIC